MSNSDAPLITETTVLQITEGQTMRGWIANSFAQIEYLFGDLVWRCRDIPGHNARRATKPSDNITEVMKRVRELIASAEFLAPYAEDLGSLIVRFEHNKSTRNLLAHGFCEYLLTPSGDAAFQFQKWQREPGQKEDTRIVRQFRLSELKAEKECSISLAQDAMKLFLRIHSDFGWVGKNSKPPPRVV